MKKISFLVIALFVVFVVSGCGNSNTKVLTCSGVNPGNNMNAAGNVEYTFKNDKLSKAKIEATFKDITIDNLSSVWDSFKTQFTEQNKPVEEVGFKRTVKSDDKNYTFSVILEIDYEKITKETMEKYGVEDYRSKTYEEIKKETTADGIFSCK